MFRRRIGIFSTIWIALTLPVAAIELEFPGRPEVLGSAAEEAVSTDLPVGPWRDGNAPIETLEGRVTKRALTLGTTDLTTLQILAPLRTQLEKNGFDIRYECRDEVCGGFDFRFLLDLLPAPGFSVDIGNFRYLVAMAEEGNQWVALVISRGIETGLVHLTILEAGYPPATEPKLTPAPSTLDVEERSEGNAAPSEDVVAMLIAKGSVALDDLTFQIGSSALGPEDFSSLTDLAAFLEDTPAARIVFVGHTDTAGSLAANIALSRRRATAVADRLVESYGIDPARVTADGVGYLAPRASNATPNGRARNRRVEAMLLTEN
ncbi:MAG: OmpA family protein [Cyanobacteria bacterium J06648_11]